MGFVLLVAAILLAGLYGVRAGPRAYFLIAVGAAAVGVWMTQP